MTNEERNKILSLEERAKLNFITVSKKEIPKHLIKEREQGKQKFSYIDGTTCIDILNEATMNLGYDFKIIEVVELRAEDKPLKEYNKVTKRQENVLDENGKQVYEKQAPYVSVTASLYVPGFGTREQCGSAALVGGTSEQENGRKGAATDAFKKCCSQFGIGAQLYTGKVEEQNKLTNEDWEKIKEMNSKLGISSTEELNSLIREFFGNYRANLSYLMKCNLTQFMKWCEIVRGEEIEEKNE
jgi:hypothetical protein